AAGIHQPLRRRRHARQRPGDRAVARGRSIPRPRWVLVRQPIQCAAREPSPGRAHDTVRLRRFSHLPFVFERGSAMKSAIAFLTTAALVTACKREEPPPTAPVKQSAAAASAATDTKEPKKGLEIR